MNRRGFISSFGKYLGTFAVANTSVYVVGSAFSNLHGNLTAGAKTWQSTGACSMPDYTNAFACGITEGATCSSLGATAGNVGLEMMCGTGFGSYSSCLTCQ